jgi:hypothetical protein
MTTIGRRSTVAGVLTEGIEARLVVEEGGTEMTSTIWTEIGITLLTEENVMIVDRLREEGIVMISNLSVVINDMGLKFLIHV